MQDLMTHKDYNYSFDPKACETCLGKCCTGESGNIFLTKSEVDAIAEYLDISLDEFKKEYLIKSGYKASIKERIVAVSHDGVTTDSHDCIFFSRETNGCSIYSVRPKQCRTFPFWSYFQNHFDELAEECIGVKKL